MKIGSKLCPLESTYGFTKIWPSDLVFDPTWPIFNSGLYFIKMNILTKFHEDWIKTVPYRVYSLFYLDLTRDLVFDPTWPMFNSGLDFIKMNILTKFHEDWILTGPYRVYSWFYSDLTSWRSFWPDMTYFHFWSRFYKDEHSNKVSWRLDQNCALWSVLMVLLRFDLVT